MNIVLDSLHGLQEVVHGGVRPHSHLGLRSPSLHHLSRVLARAVRVVAALLR